MSRRAWVLMAVLAATWGASYLFIKVGLRDFTAVQIVCIRTVLAAIVLVPVARRAGAFARGSGRSLVLLSLVQVVVPFALMRVPTSAGADSISSLLALGVLGTGLAFLIFYTLILEEGPARASLVAYIAPGFAVIYGASLLSESITAGTIGGLVLIL